MPQKQPPERNENGGEDSTESPMDTFSDLAKRLLAVTPEELREQERKWKAKRENEH